jgi:tetratricopeptide (TPR) repeat protein
LEQKLSIEGRYRETARQWPEAIAAYKTLFDHYPDNVEYGLDLARAQWEASEFQKSLTSAQALTQLPPPRSDDPRIALAVARAEYALGNYPLADSAASLAIEQAKRNGAPLIIAEADLLEVGNSSPTHGLSVEQAKADEAYRICEGLGDLDCAAWALFRKGYVDNNNEASQPIYERALKLFAATGDLRGMASVRIGIGRLLWLHGRDAEARSAFVQAQEICDQIKDQSCLWKAILNEGNVFYEAGNMPAAAERFQQALAIAQQAGESFGVAWAMANLGEVRQLQGELSEALNLFQNSAEVNRQHFGKPGALGNGYAGSALLDQGRFGEARQSLEEALAVGTQYGTPDVGDTHLTLGRLDLAQQQPANAEAKFRPPADYYESIKDKLLAAAYNDFLALALLAQGKVTEAQAATAHARQLLGAKRDGQWPLHLTITKARVAVASSPHDAQVLATALASVRSVMAQAHKTGMMKLEFEARAAEGEIEMQSGALTAGRAHLASLGRDAKAKGFELIAREASRD